MSKPKLELQVNIPTVVKLLQDKPATGENTYGQWWLYSVESEGTEYSYFAPEAVVKQLQKNNVSENDEVMITKRLVKNGKKNMVEYDLSVLETKPVPQVINGRTNGGIIPAGIRNNNGHAGKELSKDYPVMLQAMNEALLIRDELGGDVDVNKLGVTLFLRKVKP